MMNVSYLWGCLSDLDSLLCMRYNAVIIVSIIIAVTSDPDSLSQYMGTVS